MNRKTVEVFHALMKRGWIDRTEDTMAWAAYEEDGVQEELEDFKTVMGFDLFRVSDRLYMIPTQDNDLFLKNNQDYRRDISANNTVRNRDLYLLNYLSVYLLYALFGGKGTNPCRRDFISKEELIREFTEHCKMAEQTELNGDEKDYSENFRQLAVAWLGKLDGESGSQKFDEKYGLLNRILTKYKKDDIFYEDEQELIRPTRKLKDLIPYFLRKDRIQEINTWLQGGGDRAQDQ